MRLLPKSVGPMPSDLTGEGRAARPLSILGPTASGKSSLALGVTELLASQGQTAELVSVDSMQVYVGMNVGTATPTPEEQASVPHHLIDLVSPSEVFTVATFQRRARAAIADVRARGAVPILVGVLVCTSDRSSTISTSHPGSPTLAQLWKRNSLRVRQSR